MPSNKSKKNMQSGGGGGKKSNKAKAKAKAKATNEAKAANEAKANENQKAANACSTADIVNNNGSGEHHGEKIVEKVEANGSAAVVEESKDPDVQVTNGFTNGHVKAESKEDLAGEATEQVNRDGGNGEMAKLNEEIPKKPLSFAMTLQNSLSRPNEGRTRPFQTSKIEPNDANLEKQSRNDANHSAEGKQHGRGQSSKPMQNGVSSKSGDEKPKPGLLQRAASLPVSTSSFFMPNYASRQHGVSQALVRPPPIASGMMVAQRNFQTPPPPPNQSQPERERRQQEQEPRQRHPDKAAHVESPVHGPESVTKHPLRNSWTLWYFINDKSVPWEHNQLMVMTVSTVEDFWALYHHVLAPSEIRVGCDYSFFKEGIKPM
jgi:hypothetical protein